MSIYTKGINKAAYQGKLTCPFVINGVDCKSTAVRYIEHVSPIRLRYRCRKCGNTFQYDISGRDDVNPYAPFHKGRIWSNIEKVLQGRKLKGGVQ